MADFKLILGNKNYSSWSLRPWIAMRHTGIEFDEEVIPLFSDGYKAVILEHSGAGRVPILHHGDRTIWDSSSILDYIAFLHPNRRLWPEDPGARAHARSVSAEMHSGFAALRGALPMNVRRPPSPVTLEKPVREDIARVSAVWREALERYGGDEGPFLYGRFTNADAMYAPVVSRFETYAIEIDPVLRSYMDAVLSLPAFVQWRKAAAAEPWVIDRVEI